MGEKQQVKIWRSSVRVYEMNSGSLCKMWEENLNPSQQSILAKAGIFPFLKAVTYRSDNALLGALINFMVDGELTVGESRIQITEEQIRRATGLPSSGKDVSPSQDFNRVEMTRRLTRSETGAIKYGLLVDSIIDPVLQIACKFLTNKLLGLAKTSFIPFKYVEIAIEVSQGVCFNWSKFVKERMLEQIKSVRQKSSTRTSFTYGTILQYLAFQAFGEKSGIPRSDIGHGDPCINAYDIMGRDVGISKLEEKKKAREGVSYIVHNIIREHGHKALGGSGPEEKDEAKTVRNPARKKRTTGPVYANIKDKKVRLEACANEIPNMLQVPAIGVEENGCNKLAASSQLPKSGEEQKEKELGCVHTDLSTLLREKSMWEAHKISLESEKSSALEEKKQLQLHISGLKIALTTALEEKEGLRIQIARLQTEVKQLGRKLNKISEFIKMELGDI